MPATDPGNTFKQNIRGLARLAVADQGRGSALLNTLSNTILPAFPKYVDTVWSSEHLIELAYLKYGDDREMLHDRIEHYDRNRRGAHENMITACNMLNRMCAMLETPRFCPDLELDANGDEKIHRNLCADFCGDVVLETYEGRDGMQLSAERLAKIQARKDSMSLENLDAAVNAARQQGGLDERIIKHIADEPSL